MESGKAVLPTQVFERTVFRLFIATMAMVQILECEMKSLMATSVLGDCLNGRLSES